MSAWTVGRRCVAPLAFVVFFITASAQAPGTGSYPYARSDSFGFDSINPGNLNIHFAIPIVSKTGRGGLDFNYSLVYDSLIWTPVTVGSSKVWSPEASYGLHGYLLNEGYKGFLSYSSVTKKCFDDPSNPGYYDLLAAQSSFVYHDEFGGQHPFNYSYSVCTGTATGDGSSKDNSGFAYDGANVRSPSGIILFIPQVMNGATSLTNGTIVDSNGNQITNNTSGTFTDTMNTTPLLISGTGTPSSPRIFKYYTTGGSQTVVTVNYLAKTVQTAFGCSLVTEVGPVTVNLPTSIVLGDGSSTYTLGYDTAGRLTSVTLPAGGMITYTYATPNHGINCADGTTAGVSRSTNITADGTTAYTRPTIGSTTSHTEIAGPHGDQTELDYTFAGGVPYETTRKVYAGTHTSGTLLAQTETCYNGQAPTTCTAQSLSLPINRISVYRTIGPVENGSDTLYSTHGSPTDIKEYDYGTGSRSATVLRETKYTYAVLGSYITDKVATVQQYDGSGNQFAGTTYGYDDTTLQATSGLSQHIAASGPRGNLTSEYDYPNGSTSIAEHALVDDAGQVLSTWGTDTAATTGEAYAPQDTLLTSISPAQPNSISLTTNIASDSYTGLVTSLECPANSVVCPVICTSEIVSVARKVS